TCADEMSLLNNRSENRFYHSWVDLTGEDVFKQMLETDDISKGNILSLLNSRFIEEIATRALVLDATSRVDRPYFDKNFKIFLTLSNLRGYWYNLFFRSANDERSAYF